jgi:hypothetical protein
MEHAWILKATGRTAVYVGRHVMMVRFATVPGRASYLVSSGLPTALDCVWILKATERTAVGADWIAPMEKFATGLGRASYLVSSGLPTALEPVWIPAPIGTIAAVAQPHVPTVKSAMAPACASSPAKPD